MALMGNAGIQAEMAGTSLQQAIFRLVEPTGKAAGVMEDLGIHATDAHGRLLPLDQIVEQLEPRFENTAAMATIFGSRAIKGMGALVTEGSDKLRALTTELEHAGGTAQEVADKKLAGLTGAWTRLQSATEGVFIEIGTRLSPVLERLAAFLTDRVLPAVRGALEGFDRLSPGIQTAVIAATALTAAIGPLLIVLGGVTATLTPLLPLFVALGKMKAVVAGLAAVKTVLAAVGITATTTWAAILGPLTLVVAGIAAVALAFTHWDAIRETLGLVESQAVTTTDKLEEARTALERMSKTSRRANTQRRHSKPRSPNRIASRRRGRHGKPDGIVIGSHETPQPRRPRRPPSPRLPWRVRRRRSRIWLIASGARARFRPRTTGRLRWIVSGA